MVLNWAISSGFHPFPAGFCRNSLILPRFLLDVAQVSVYISGAHEPV